MGLFSFSYNKPGPGVSPDTPRKRGVARLLEVLGRDMGPFFKAGFLAVRIPGESRDNLGRFLGLTEADLLRTAHMESAAVASAFRGHGLQGRMMAEAERMLRERGFSWLMGTVHPENIYSRNHFLKLGYEAAVRTEMYGGLPREIMVKKL